MKKALIQLHIAVFLAGFTGILGSLIQLNEGLLVWYRMMITIVSLGVLLLIQKQLVRIAWTDLLKLISVGTLVALHWATFYGSIKYANVSIALVSFSTIGFFTAVLEPIILNRKLEFAEVSLGILTIVGVYLIFNFNPDYKTGIVLGLISALLYVLFSIFNKKLVARLPVMTITFYELGGGWIILSLLMPFYLRMFPTTNLFPTFNDWVWLLLLALVCTVLVFRLQLNALSRLTTFTNNLTYNLEPVYGIILAFIFLGEKKYFNVGFYIGLSLIFAAVILQMVRIFNKQIKKKLIAEPVARR
jgi:drug/metabolite transporter (DMT)-like permease